MKGTDYKYIVKYLVGKYGTTLSALSRHIGYANQNNLVGNYKVRNVNSEVLKKTADFFGLGVDQLENMVSELEIKSSNIITNNGNTQEVSIGGESDDKLLQYLEKRCKELEEELARVRKQNDILLERALSK